MISGLVLLWGVAGLQAALPAASSNDPSRLSIQEAIQNALLNNASISAAKSQVRASEARITQALSGFYPQLYVAEVYQRTNNPMYAFGAKLNQQSITQQDFMPEKLNNPSPIDNFNSRVGMKWALFDSGKTWFGWEQADMAHQSSALGLDRTRQDVIFKTIAAYTDLVFAQNSAVVVDQALETARSHLKVVKARYRNGLTVKSDVLSAKVHIAELEQGQVSAQNGVLAARAALNAVMGAEMNENIHTATPLARASVPEMPLSEWVDTALHHRPDLMQLNYQEKTARIEVKKSRAAYLPEVMVNGAYELNSEDLEDGGKSYMVGANITMNLFTGFYTPAKSKEALHLLDAVKAGRRGMKQKIRLETEQAYYALQSAEARIDTAKAAVAESEEAMRIILNRYDNGQVAVISLLDAETALYRAKNNYFQALKDQVQARAQLALAAGTLDESTYEGKETP